MKGKLTKRIHQEKTNYRYTILRSSLINVVVDFNYRYKHLKNSQLYQLQKVHQQFFLRYEKISLFDHLP